MYSIENNEVTYWFATEELFNEALESKGKKMLLMADLVFNSYTRELVKCRYDLKEIIESYMLRKSHEHKMNECYKSKGE